MYSQGVTLDVTGIISEITSTRIFFSFIEDICK